MPSKKVTKLTLECIEEFRVWLSLRGRSENTVKAYVSDLREFLIWKEGKFPTKTLTAIQMSQFENLAMTWLNEYRRIIKPATTARRLTSLRTFAKYAKVPNLLEDYSAPTASRQIPHPIPEGIAGVHKMISVCDNDRKKTLIALIGLVGLRVGETLQVEPTDFNFNDRTLLVHGKGERDRVVAYSPEAWAVIEERVLHAFAYREPLIGWCDRFARKIVTDTARKAGLSRSVSSHDLRATCLTAMYDKTRDIMACKEQAGHQSVTTTQIYVENRLENMHAAVAGL